MRLCVSVRSCLTAAAVAVAIAVGAGFAPAAEAPAAAGTAAPAASATRGSRQPATSGCPRPPRRLPLQRPRSPSSRPPRRASSPATTFTSAAARAPSTPRTSRRSWAIPSRSWESAAAWYEIDFPGSGFSWVDKQYVQKVDDTTGIAITNVNVRSGPGIQFDNLYTVPSGHKFRIIATDPSTGAWYRVEQMPGTTAWISADYLRVAGTVPESSTGVAAAGTETPQAAGTGESQWATPPETGTAPQTPEQAAAANQPWLDKLAQAEQLFKTETSRDNPADWDLDSITKMYTEIAEGAPSAITKNQARIRLAQLGAYRQVQARWKELGKVDEDLKAQLAELEKQRQQDITAAAARSAEEMPYLATGTIEKFYISGMGGATHKLVSGDRILYLLKSSVVDLSGLEGKRAGVKGKILDIPDQSIKVIDVTAVSVLPAQ